jgi:2-dehydropantoate 2-reductase
MKHAILGAGAIGGLVGTVLASLGEDVTVVVRPEKLPDYPVNLLLERPSGSLMAPARAVASLTEPVDVLWIATKTYQLQTALEAVRVSPAHMVPLLNGVDHVAVLRARFGSERAAPATIAVEAERIAPGRFIQRSPFVRFNLAASLQALLGGIVAQLGNLGFTCQFVANEQTLLWASSASLRRLRW